MKIYYIFIGIALSSLSLFAEKIEGYTQLEYLDTTGKEWFDTGLKTKSVYNIKAKLQSFAIGYSPKGSAMGASAPWYALYGGGDGSKNKVIMAAAVCWDSKYLPGVISMFNDSNYIYYWSTTPNPAIPLEYTYYHGSTVYFSYGSQKYGNGHTRGNFTSDNNFYIAAANVPGLKTYPGIMRIWYFQIMDTSNGNKLLRDYIPVRRNSDGEVGLYDKVENVFYGNASGEGSVKAGPSKVEEWVVADSGLFNYSAEWTISGYSGNSTLKGVPVLLRLSPQTVEGFSYRQCLDQGKDIAFSSKEDFSDRLPYEIEEWDTAGESLIWVKVPSISGKTTKIYMRWGRTVPAINLASTEVWSEYLGVWHMNNYDEEKGALDSSAYGRHAKIVSAVEAIEPALPTKVPAKVGFGLQTAANTRFEAESLHHFPEKYDDMPLYFTVSIWAKKTGTYLANNDIIGCHQGVDGGRHGWVAQYGSANEKNYCYLHYGMRATKYNYMTGVSISDWQYYTLSSDAGEYVRMYYNGAQKTSAPNAKYLGGIDKPLSILGPICTMPAIGDEVRISKTVLSADRIKADYQMMTVPDFAVCSSVFKLRKPGFSIIVR